MKLANEQIKAILDGAPEGATKFAEYVDCYYFKPAIPHGLKLYSPFVDKWQWVHDCSMLRGLRDLSDLRELLELRQEVERLKESHDDVINAFDCGDDDDLQRAVGRMIDQLREQGDE